MKRTFATYEHSTIGFPKIKLKWAEQDGRFSEPYVTIHDKIVEYGWHWKNLNPVPFVNYEMELFDNWVREKYGNDISVQG